jgi:hypothetical protein
MSTELSASPSIDKEKPTASVEVTKEQAQDLRIGLAIRLELTGEIREVSQCYNDKEHYRVVIEDPSVENVTPQEKAEDEKDAATMPLDELKKIVSKL